MNFTELAFNPINRMNEVSRYSSVYQETNESLAEHVTEVMTMSYLIAADLKKNCNEILNLSELLQKCLLHDVDEVITGDVPRNTKYATSLVHMELNSVAETAVKMIEESLGVPIYETWSSAKENKEGKILRIVDMLCVVKKCITEIELRGNLTFLKVVAELEVHLSNTLNNSSIYEEFSVESSNYLRQLVSQAKDEITTIRVKYQDVINKYHIKENVIRCAD